MAIAAPAAPVAPDSSHGTSHDSIATILNEGPFLWVIGEGAADAGEGAERGRVRPRQRTDEAEHPKSTLRALIASRRGGGDASARLGTKRCHALPTDRIGQVADLEPGCARSACVTARMVIRLGVQVVLVQRRRGGSGTSP